MSEATDLEQGLALRPGQSFRGLLVHSELGAGAMGTAYLASHPLLQMPLVIKIFALSASEDLFAEAHLAARVRSPHVVDVLDAGVEDGLPFVVQRYVDGIDLQRLIALHARLGRGLPLGAVTRALGDIARGLQAIHLAGVVHRDVKPANLFLAGDGGALVGDFGVAVASGGDDEAMQAGTPEFMAPEQWRSPSRPGRGTDIYALGATAHALLTGQPVFRGSIPQLALAHSSQAYQPPAAEGPAQAYVLAMVARMLRKEVDQRHPSAEAVARELAPIVQPLPEWVDTGPDEARCGPLSLRLVAGDLTEATADVIVNAANTDLAMNLGVASALRKAGGQQIEDEAKAQAPLTMGSVVWTGAGELAARHVAHAVAAISGAVCIQRATLITLLEAEALGAGRVAFPALGTGVGRVPMELAAKLMLEAFRCFAGLEPRCLRELTVVLIDEPTRDRWRVVLDSMCLQPGQLTGSAAAAALRPSGGDTLPRPDDGSLDATSAPDAVSAPDARPKDAAPR